MDRCLNCGEALRGGFCFACGQRAVPPNPTTRELAGDAWNELTGYDGRIAATIRGLLHPGQLTRDYLSGRRAHYLPPLRVYLAVSVLYFVTASAAPLTDRQGAALVNPGGSGFRIGLFIPERSDVMSAEELAEARRQIAEAPVQLQPLLRKVFEDPIAFRQRMFTTMPRVLFAMLPVYAGIVAMFYRGRTFPTAIVFAVHVHAFAFLVLTASELAKFTEAPVFAAAVGVLAMVALVVYALRAFRVVYGGSWLATGAKAMGIGFVYLLTAIPAFIVMFAWAAL